MKKFDLFFRYTDEKDHPVYWKKFREQSFDYLSSAILACEGSAEQRKDHGLEPWKYKVTDDDGITVYEHG